jgi:hypothetical protein
VTVRIQVVVLGPSTGGQGPNTSPDLAWTGSDGVAEVHKRQAAARVRAAFSSRSTARAFASAEARLFPRIHRSGPLSVWTDAGARCRHPKLIGARLSGPLSLPRRSASSSRPSRAQKFFSARRE